VNFNRVLIEDIRKRGGEGGEEEEED